MSLGLSLSVYHVAGPNATDRALVMRSCREDGLLLQPDKPLTAIDAMYDGRVAPHGGFKAAGYAQVWTTYSRIGSAHNDITRGNVGNFGHGRAAASPLAHRMDSVAHALLRSRDDVDAGTQPEDSHSRGSNGATMVDAAVDPSGASEPMCVNYLSLFRTICALLCPACFQ